MTEMQQVMNTKKKETVSMQQPKQQKSSFIPLTNPSYVPWGNYETIKKIVESGRFFPVWVSGNAGCGKTTEIEQACAAAGRELIRVNFTAETSEDDLVVSLRLTEENGVTVTEMHEGPVLEALRRGAVLLLDDVDFANTNRILTLQSVLEGRGLLVKQTGEYVHPKAGFTVFATSNTQGRGSDDGRFIGVNIMNGAFLDRFAMMLHQDYPPSEVEQNILRKYLEHYLRNSNGNDKLARSIEAASDAKSTKFVADFATWAGKLTNWANHVRESFKNGTGLDEVITTRSLINVVQHYVIFEDKDAAVKAATDRFNSATGMGMYDIYQKLRDDLPVEEKKKDKPNVQTFGDIDL